MNDLSTLMRSRVDTEHLDLTDLASRSILRGRRIRRVRYAGAGFATAAVVAGVAVGAAALPGGNSAATELQPAASGPAGITPNSAGAADAPLHAGQLLRLAHGVTATVVACTAAKVDPVGGNPGCVLPPAYTVEGSSTITGSGTGFAVVLTGSAHAVSSFWSNGFQSPLLDPHKGLTYALPADSPLVRAVYQGQAVSIHLAGWRQVGEVADDKQSLEGPNGAVADIVWRPASDHDAWVTDSDKGKNAATWTSPVHHGIFVTIQGGQGTTDAQVQALGASLRWK